MPGDSPQAVELYAIRDVPDLSVYSVETSNVFPLPSGVATAGDYIFLTNDLSDFASFFTILPNVTIFDIDVTGTQGVRTVAKRYCC